MTTATALARHLLAQWRVWGVEHVVLCPGSRSAPLAFAAWEAAGRGELTLHTRIDERSAAFLALGMAKASRRPAVVVTTSGTAAANLHPAVLEAAHAGVPLVVVTADRPAVLRGTGANQTTDQVDLFGDAAPCTDMSAPRALEPPHAGPIHLNVQFTEPLVPGDDEPAGWLAAAPTVVEEKQSVVPVRLPIGPRTVVVAGDDAGPAARVLAESAHWPLLAEPTSGARNGENAIRTYRLLLGSPLGEAIERVVVVGHPTLSRPVTRLLSRDDVEVVSVPPAGRWPTRPFPVALEAARFEARPDSPAWLEQWKVADRELSAKVDQLLAGVPGLTPYDVAAAVHAALPADGLLVVGASNPIRDLDLMAGAHPVGQRRRIVANRGLAGIDGVLSTAIGMSLARESSRAIALVGDVTFLHDQGALTIGPDEQRPDLTIVVANDDGGSIFSVLEQGAPEFADSFEKLFATPHHVDLASLCAATRTPHWRIDSRAELEHALASPAGGIEVVEAVIGRAERRELDARLRALV